MDAMAGRAPGSGVFVRRAGLAHAFSSRRRRSEPGDDVTQGGELGGDRVAALGEPVDLDLERLQLALGVGVAAVAQRVGLLLGGARTICSASRRERLISCSASCAVCSRWALAASVASRARCSAVLARSSASATRRLVSATAASWFSAASRVSRSFSTASVRRASCTSRSAVARCCSASRVALVRSASISCSAARRCCSASRLRGGEVVVGLGHRRGCGAPRCRRSCGCGSPRARASARCASPRPSASASVLTDAASRWPARGSGLAWAVGLGDHLAGLLLGQAQHLAGLAAEPGVGRVLVLLDGRAQRLDLALSAFSRCWAWWRLAERPAFSARVVRTQRSTAAVS